MSVQDGKFFLGNKYTLTAHRNDLEGEHSHGESEDPLWEQRGLEADDEAIYRVRICFPAIYPKTSALPSRQFETENPDENEDPYEQPYVLRDGTYLTLPPPDVELRILDIDAYEVEGEGEGEVKYYTAQGPPTFENLVVRREYFEVTVYKQPGYRIKWIEIGWTARPHPVPPEILA
jgi:hypothetical protein